MEDPPAQVEQDDTARAPEPTIRVVRLGGGPNSGPLAPLWATLFALLVSVLTGGRQAVGNPAVWLVVGVLAGPNLLTRAAPWLRATIGGLWGTRPSPDVLVPWLLVLCLSVVLGERFVRSRSPPSRVTRAERCTPVR